jgi:hypothetical protein
MKKAPLILLSVISCFSMHGQIGGDADWSGAGKVEAFASSNKHASSDAVILNDNTTVLFLETGGARLQRLVSVKLNNAEGVSAFSSIILPESFDPAYDQHHFRMSRRARIKTPPMSDYKVKRFVARIYRSGKWSKAKVEDRYVQNRWVASDGAFRDEDVTVCNIANLKPGDILQYYCEADFSHSYGSGPMYFYARYPKLEAVYVFNYKVRRMYRDEQFVLPVNVADSCVKTDISGTSGDAVVSKQITLRNIPGVNYPANAYPARALPHVIPDLAYYKLLSFERPLFDKREEEFEFIRQQHFRWLVIKDTSAYTKTYDNRTSNLHKFAAHLPPLGNDTQNVKFLKAFSDTINAFRYLTRNHIYYNEPGLSTVSSTDHLLKRRLTAQSLTHLREILDENGIRYFNGNIIDKRLGGHSKNFRAHNAYERGFLAIPIRNRYYFYIARTNGIKYHINELPFYYEGDTAAVLSCNEVPAINNGFGFIKTPRAGHNENVRTGNAVIKIRCDSAITYWTMRESLSGQFSTLLRHHYSGDPCDSTISPHYYKKCTDIPGAKSTQIKLTSKSAEFPFKQNYTCRTTLPIIKNTVPVGKGFCFPLTADVYAEAPTHDFYFDFMLTDIYNLQLEFSSPVEIENAAAFTKKISNDYFDFESSIASSDDKSCLMQVKLSVKQDMLPVKDAVLLAELTAKLRELENFDLRYKSK